MTCGCEPVSGVASVNCCVLAASLPTGQYVRWSYQEVGNPAVLIPAYQLINGTATVVPVSAGSRFWVYSLSVKADAMADQLDLFWSIGAAVATTHAHFFRGAANAAELYTYNGPAVPLPVNAELRLLAESAITINVVGYGLLETI